MSSGGDAWLRHWQELMEREASKPDASVRHPPDGVGRPGSNGQAPKRPADLDKPAWREVLQRTVREFKEDDLIDRAAALTYFGVLAIFPAILALVSILGLVGKSVTQPLIDNVGRVAPGPAKDIFTSTVQNLQKSRGTGGALFIVGLAVALWSASGYVAAFMRASNAIYEVKEGRPLSKKIPVRLGVTLIVGRRIDQLVEQPALEEARSVWLTTGFGLPSSPVTRADISCDTSIR